ncbi:hypothetical protein PYCC9005_004153 [Savitreella phatthalungensis]
MAKVEQSDDSVRDELVNKWNEVYKTTLPTAARAKDSGQRIWPVVLDHCFARIILDKVVGSSAKNPNSTEDVPWTKVLASPAYKHMTSTQLRDAIALAHDILDGSADLVALNEDSLQARGKQGTAAQRKAVSKERAHLDKKLAQPEHSSPPPKPPTKRKRDDSSHDGTLSKYFAAKHDPSKAVEASEDNAAEVNSTDNDDADQYREMIRRETSWSDHRRACLLALLDIPRGRWTTYGEMARYLGSSARAVGAGMRNNPFAPAVPCHRVCAADRSLGGYGGDWGPAGRNAPTKIKLLRDEGCRFDGHGKLTGQPYKFPDKARVA